MSVCRSKLVNLVCQRATSKLLQNGRSLSTKVLHCELVNNNQRQLVTVKSFSSPLINGFLIYNKRNYTKPTEVQDILKPEERITVSEYKAIKDSGEKHLLIDVRPEDDAARVKLDQSINLPLKQLLKENGFDQLRSIVEQSKKDGTSKVYVMCRKGISSQIAVKFMKERLPTANLEIKDIVGGITAWSKEIDPSIKID